MRLRFKERHKIKRIEANWQNLKIIKIMNVFKIINVNKFFLIYVYFYFILVELRK